MCFPRLLFVFLDHTPWSPGREEPMGGIRPAPPADATAKSHEPRRIMQTLPLSRIDAYVMSCTAEQAAPLPALFCG
jgi:hypothetical protein